MPLLPVLRVPPAGDGSPVGAVLRGVAAREANPSARRMPCTSVGGTSLAEVTGSLPLPDPTWAAARGRLLAYTAAQVRLG